MLLISVPSCPSWVSRDVGGVQWWEAGSALHTVAIKVAQQQAQFKVHGATSSRVQPIAIGPTVDGVTMEQLRPTTHKGPRQLLLPAAQWPPSGAVQLVGTWTAGHMAKAIAFKLAAAKAILGPHLEMEPGPACRTRGRQKGRDGCSSPTPRSPLP